MDSNLKSLPSGDPKLIDSIVSHLKCEGIFDEFRKSCLADVDTKPAYQNLRTRVESFADDYMKNTQWRSDLNKNQLRDGLRRHIHDSGLLTNGVDRIIDQVVNPKIIPFFLPKIVEIVCRLLGIVKQETPTVSVPSAPGGPKQVEAASQIKEELQKLASKLESSPLNSVKKTDTKSPKHGSTDGVKSKSPDAKSTTSNKSKISTASISKNVKSSDESKSTVKKDTVSPKMKSNESPKTDESSAKKSTEKPRLSKSISVEDKEPKKNNKSQGKDETEKNKSEKAKIKSKSESTEEVKAKTTEKKKVSDSSKTKTVEQQKSTEGDKSKLKDSPSVKEKSGSAGSSKKPCKNFEKALMTGEVDKVSSSQSSKVTSNRDEKSVGKKESVKKVVDKTKSKTTGKDKASSSNSSRKQELKTIDKEGKPPWKESDNHSQLITKDRLKRKSEDEGSQDSKKAKTDGSPTGSPSFQDKLKEKRSVDEDDGELSDVTVSSVHTSDLSDFDDRISLSDSEDEESGSQSKTTTKPYKKEKHAEEHKAETAEDKKAGLKISEDALMSSDELRSTGAGGKEDANQSEPKRELRRQRKVNPKYASEDFSTIFGGNHDKIAHQSQQEEEIKESKTPAYSSSADKSESMKSSMSDLSSEPAEATKYNLCSNPIHSPILSSDDDLSNSREGYSPKIMESEKKISQTKMRNKPGSSSDGESFSPQQTTSNTTKNTKTDSRQRYESTDLYKPRPVINHSRRRTSTSVSAERRDYIDSERGSIGSDMSSPHSSYETNSPSQSKKSPKDQSDFHLPLTKRRRVPHN